MNKLNAALAFAVAFSLTAPAESYTYTPGDTSLGNGAVTITYDGDTTDIATLTAKPTGGEELRITGTAMTFADSRTKTWSGNLVIKGFRAGAVRFGTNSAALSLEQQSLIKADDGRCLHLLANGYLAPYGSRITIR